MSDQDRAVKLSETQESLVADVLASRVPARHVLVAPAGTGKGMVAVECIRRLSSAKPDSRALLLCPSSLLHQYAARLTMALEPARVEAVDRHRYRELDAAAPLDGSPFAPSTAIILGIDLAKHEDVTRGLLATPWDILIVDEAHDLRGQRARVVQQLIEAGRIERALFMSAMRPRGFVPPGAVVLNLPSIAAHLRGTEDALSVQLIDVIYTEPEQAVFAKLQAVADDLARVDLKVVSTILVRARSCFYALEQFLREIRNRTAEGVVPGTVDGPNRTDSRSLIVEGADRVLAALDDIEIDSKMEALYAFLTSRLQTLEGTSAAILTRFSDTAEYLSASLSSRGVQTRCLTGDMPPNQIMTAMEQLIDPGVTVMSLASVRGFDFPPIATWVVYEPADDRSLYVALSRARSAKSGQSTTVFTFDPPELRMNE